jgi:hypothetical protein
VAEIAISLLSSAITGVAVAVLSWLGRRRRIERMRAFFGVRPGSRPLLVVGQHAASVHEMSVHLNDAAGVVDMAAMVMTCGGEPELVGQHQVPKALGAVAEMCVGGPYGNSRTATHLRFLAPGIELAVYDEDPSMTITIGDDGYSRDGDVSYALLVKTFGPQGGAPVFLICGQTALDNRAAARYLTQHHRVLARRYGLTGRFAVMLQMKGVYEYGTDAVDVVEDVSLAAFDRTAPTRPDPAM